jgi:pilus assembly protein CpaB
MKSRLRRLVSGGSILVLGVGLAIVTFVATLSYLNEREGDASPASAAASASQAQERVPGPTVVVVRQDVPAGIELTAAMLDLREVPDGTTLAGVVTTLDQAVGRVSRYPLFRGEQVVSAKLVGSEGTTGTGLAFSIPPKMRAVSISISQVTTAGGLIVPGDRVDILVATDYERLFEPGAPLTDAERGPVVFTLLQDVLVLAIAQTTTPPLDPERDQATLRSQDAEPQPGAGTATVAVTPEQTQLLFMASQQGALGLALRPYGEQAIEVLRPRLKLEPVYDSTIGLASVR